MADFTLNVDWHSTALAGCGNQTPLTRSSANDWLAQAITDTSTKGGQQNVDVPPLIVRAWGATLVYYKMQGMDQLTDGLYATWIVTGTPDRTGARYSGALNLPLRDIHIVDSWT